MTYMYIIAALFAYLLGSISFAVIFTKLFAKTDVRLHGSGNAGTTNVMRVAGVLPGTLTFIADLLKGFLSSYVGKHLFLLASGNEKTALIGAYLCGIICMFGHSFPVFFSFKGGKCAATGTGVLLCCCPKAILIGLAVFAVSMLICRIVSVSTLLATTVTVVLSSVFNSDSPAIIVMSIIIAIIVFIRHAENIKRLFSGTEKPLKIKKDKTE